MNVANDSDIHKIAKNIDYSLKINVAKFILVVSDLAGEGKSTFLSTCTPVLSSLYKKRILIYDCQPERNDILEKAFSHGRGELQFIQSSELKGPDYIHSEDLTFLNALPEYEKSSAITAHFNEISKIYDLVFINMKTLKRAEKTTLPILPVDAAIIIRSPKSFAKIDRFLTNELLDREIPILGLIKNEGMK